MTKDAVDQLREALQAESSALQTVDDVNEFQKGIASLLQRLECDLAALLGEPAESASTEELLYRRAVRDFAALQAELAVVRHALSDRRRMLRVLQESGHEVDSTRQHLTMVAAMDRALQHLVHLMQYDTRDRAEIDIRNGFQLSSGSTNYGRFYFAPTTPSQ